MKRFERKHTCNLNSQNNKNVASEIWSVYHGNTRAVHIEGSVKYNLLSAAISFVPHIFLKM
jgi:hypothetical protein